MLNNSRRMQMRLPPPCMLSENYSRLWRMWLYKNMQISQAATKKKPCLSICVIVYHIFRNCSSAIFIVKVNSYNGSLVRVIGCTLQFYYSTFANWTVIFVWHILTENNYTTSNPNYFEKPFRLFLHCWLFWTFWARNQLKKCGYHTSIRIIISIFREKKR